MMKLPAPNYHCGGIDCFGRLDAEHPVYSGQCATIHEEDDHYPWLFRGFKPLWTVFAVYHAGVYHVYESSVKWGKGRYRLVASVPFMEVLPESVDQTQPVRLIVEGRKKALSSHATWIRDHFPKWTAKAQTCETGIHAHLIGHCYCHHDSECDCWECKSERGGNWA